MCCKDKWKTALEPSWNHPAQLSSVPFLFCLPGLLPNHIFPLHLDTLPATMQPNSSCSWHEPQPSRMRILTHSWELVLKVTEQVRPKGERRLPDDKIRKVSTIDGFWLLKLALLKCWNFHLLPMYFLADVLFVVIAVVPFGISSVLQSKENLFKDLAANCVFVGDGHSWPTTKWGDTNCIHPGSLYVIKILSAD